ncbi:MAG: OFA family MFS transporter, partial [Coriobacteriaceae bacterium]|nr:OFA family MFS transporter [Coriobacteriaceae bacterium]
ALLVGLVSTMNGISRPINGAIFDRFGLIPVMLIQAAITALTMLALAISFSGSLPQLYFVAAIMIAFPYGSAPVMASAFARQRYGAEGFAKNLGVVNLTIAAGSMISIAIGLIVGSAGDGINDDTIYLVLAFLAVVAFASVFLFRRVYTEDLKKIDEELQ